MYYFFIIFYFYFSDLILFIYLLFILITSELADILCFLLFCLLLRTVHFIFSHAIIRQLWFVSTRCRRLSVKMYKRLCAGLRKISAPKYLTEAKSELFVFSKNIVEWYPTCFVRVYIVGARAASVARCGDRSALGWCDAVRLWLFLPRLSRWFWLRFARLRVFGVSRLSRISELYGSTMQARCATAERVEEFSRFGRCPVGSRLCGLGPGYVSKLSPLVDSEVSALKGNEL